MKLTYTPFKDHPEALSGKKYIATDEDGKKYLVKHIYSHNAANEYVACWLADKLQVPAPKAYLLTPDYRLESPFAVAIEFMDGLSMPPKDKTPYLKDYAAIYVLGALIQIDDKLQMNFFSGHVVTYDFSEAFGVDEWNITETSDSISHTYYLERIANKMRTFSSHLSYTDFKFDSCADEQHLDRAAFNAEALKVAKRALIITDADILAMKSELMNLYREEIAEYYAECIRKIRVYVTQ